MSTPLRCRWLLTLKTSEATAARPSTEQAVAELRRVLQDDSLLCTAEARGSLVLVLEGTWAGYLHAEKAQRAHQLTSLGGCPVLNIEPAFTADYLARIKGGDPFVLDNFAKVYGPLFLKAVRLVRGRFGSDWNVPPAEEILLAVWERFFAKLPQLLAGYSQDRGAQSAYLFAVAKHMAIDFLRKVVNDPAEPTEEDEIPQPGPLDRVYEVIASRQLAHKLVETFERLSKRHTDRKKPSDWEFFEEHFLRQGSKEELCQLYKMSSNTFDMRVHRIRDRLKALLRKQT